MQTRSVQDGQSERRKTLRRDKSGSNFVLFFCVCDLRRWRRGAGRSDYNTTSAGLSVARKNQRRSGCQINWTAPLNFSHGG